MDDLGESGDGPVYIIAHYLGIEVMGEAQKGQERT